MVKNLNEASKQETQSFFDSFDTVLTDCDGVLWKGNNAIQGSPELIHQFRKMGKRVIYVTNNSRKTRKEYVKKCEDLGFGGTYEEFFTTSFLVASYLKSLGFDKKVYLYGSAGIAKELDEHNIKHVGLGPDPIPDECGISNIYDCLDKAASEMDPDVGCVVASIDFHASYIKMFKAVSHLKDPNVLYLATNLDERAPYGPNLMVPGTGSLVSTITVGSGRQPKVLGKPEEFMFEAVQKDFPDIKPERTLMIGDNLKTDVQLGKRCGLKTLMVGSGVDTLETAKSLDESHSPDYFVNKLGDLLSA